MATAAFPGVHSIMLEKLAQAGDGVQIKKYKVAVYAPAELPDTLPLFLLYPYVLWGRHAKNWSVSGGKGHRVHDTNR